MPRGGARVGSGRKPKAQKFETEINAAERHIADRLPQYLETLDALALLGNETVYETWEPAGTVVIDDVIVDETSGKEQKVKRLAFPGKRADELVLVQRRVQRTGPSETANIYLINRVAGTPTQRVEAEVDVDGLDITEQVRDAAAQELAAWRKQMSEQLSSLPSAPPTLPTSPTSTE